MFKITKYFFITILTFLIVSNANSASAPESFADLAEDLTPAVVNISTSQTIKQNENNPLGDLFSYNFPDGGQNPFGELPELFKKFYGENENGERKSSSLGSGFVIDPDGYIVTNHHVVDKADKITVVFNDDTKVEAKLIGKDAKTDIALLKIKVNKKLKYVKWGNSDKVRVGDWVLAIGNPFGLGGSVSAGIISARARDINAGPFDDFLQTDAAINRGNSGGPLFNMDGEVVGVNSAIFSPSGGSVGIGFSVPTSLAQPIISQLKDSGHVKRGWLGVKIQTVTDEIADSLGLKKAKGALVLDVNEDSPAKQAGMLAGDVILSFDGKEVTTMRKLPRIVAETKVGKKVPVVVWRKEKEKTLIVTVAQLDEEKENDSINEEQQNLEEDESPKASKELMGLGVKNLDKNLRNRFGIADNIKGVIIIDINPEGPAAQKPIKPGDIITDINQEPISSIVEMEKLINESKKSGKKSVLFLINRDNSTQFIALSFK